MAIKNLIFDVGNVLLEYRWRDMMRDMGLAPEDAERVGEELFNDPDHLWHIFDLATMTEEEIIEAYERKYPDDAWAIRFFISHGEYMHVARPEVWEKVHALKNAGYHIYLLSNYPEKLFKKHTEYCDFMSDLDGLVVSYMLNITKPDPEIYHALLDRYGLSASECLFFDDREENVLGARAVGMQSTLVTGRKMLSDTLDEMLRTS